MPKGTISGFDHALTFDLNDEVGFNAVPLPCGRSQRRWQRASPPLPETSADLTPERLAPRSGGRGRVDPVQPPEPRFE
jgi:hypothetical protein